MEIKYRIERVPQGPFDQADQIQDQEYILTMVTTVPYCEIIFYKYEKSLV